MPLKLLQLQFAVTRVVTRLLRAVGLRDRVYAWRLDRRRDRRRAEEARGSDRLSRPALHELDRQLDLIIDRDGGFFVEAGANDGFTQSNTYWFERFRGWQGLLVEPMPELAEEARRSRPRSTVIQCALGPETAVVRMAFGDLMSTIVGTQADDWSSAGVSLGWRDAYELDVPARRLSDLLDEVDAPEIDLLSLDIEGFEVFALQGLDFDRHAPRYVLVEIHNRECLKPPIDAVLAERYREHAWLSPHDLLYVRNDVVADAPAGA